MGRDLSCKAGMDRSDVLSASPCGQSSGIMALLFRVKFSIQFLCKFVRRAETMLNRMSSVSVFLTRVRRLVRGKWSLQMSTRA